MLRSHPGVHVVFQDLDVLPLSSAWLPLAFARPFSLGVVTRPPNIYAALNCGLLLFHRGRLEQAAALFELALDLYRGANYFSLHRLVRGHSCCAQHVLQHALELVLGSGQWQRYSSRLTYHTSMQQQQHSHHQPQLSSPPADTTGLAMDVSQNTSCLADFPNLSADSFVLLSLPLREYLPSPSNSSSSSQLSSQPVRHSKMLHYKGRWKQDHMARDYQASLGFDFQARPEDQARFRLLVTRAYSGGSSSSACVLPCCDSQEACQQPTLLLAPAQCHRQLFKYRWIEQYYLRKREQPYLASTPSSEVNN